MASKGHVEGDACDAGSEAPIQHAAAQLSDEQAEGEDSEQRVEREPPPALAAAAHLIDAAHAPPPGRTGRPRGPHSE